MGIHDRDYYRDGGRFSDTWAGGRAVTALLILTIGLLLIQVLTKDARGPGVVTETFMFQPDLVLRGEVWRILGGAFLPMLERPEIFGFLCNLLILWYFGREMEERYGTTEFLGFYVTAAVLGVLAQLALTFAGVGGLKPDVPVVCWSGPVTAVLILFALHHPRQTILLMFLIPVPIWIVVAFQVLKDLSGFFSGGVTPFGAHLGGAAVALAYYQFNVRLTNWLPRRGAGRPARARKPQLRVFRDEDTAVPAPADEHAEAAPVAAAPVDEALEAKVDALLAKVAQHGQESLTPEEREILFRASEVYRRKRKSQ